MDGIVQIGVIGAGAISDTYLTNLTAKFPNVRVRAVCARHMERAHAKATKYGISACWRRCWQTLRSSW